MKRWQSLLACLYFAAVPVWAALPDPTAFGVAVEAGRVDQVRAWLDEGLDPNFVADRIGTGTMIAAWEGNVPMLELFVSRGADLARTNRYGEQALLFAAWRGQTEAVRWLLDHGAAINRQGAAWSALHYAAFAGNEETARLLLERGADVNGRAPNGSTALMMSAREGKEDTARMLLAAGADPRLVNEKGESALVWAMRYGNYRIAQQVSSKDEFAKAVQAPPESFGKPVRSVPAPSAIEEILRRMRAAEAAGKSTAMLRQALDEAIARFRQNSTVVSLKDKPGKRSTGLVITASRGRPGERAEMTYATPGSAAPATVYRGDAEEVRKESDRLHRLLDELQQAQAEGRPTAEIRRELMQAVADFKNGTRITLPPTPGPNRP